MSSDLVSLRVLVLSAAGREQDLLRRGAALASLPLEFEETDNAEHAIALLKRGGTDLLLLDLPDAAERDGVSQAARAAGAQTHIVFVCDDPGQAAVGGGADAAGLRPRSVEEARHLLDCCVQAKLPCRVLVVDDSPTMRSIVRKIIGASRFPLRADDVGSGLAGLAHVRSGRFGLVFLDYNMPGLNGLATLAELKRANPDLTVVVMTSTHDNAVAERALAAGAAAFLKKPFYPADIDAVMYRRCGLTPLQRTGA